MTTPIHTLILTIIASSILSACISTQSGQTHTPLINAPNQINFDDNLYQQTSYTPKNIGGIIAQSYEYTTDSETLENWNTLITLTHTNLDAPPETVLNNLSQTLENLNPKPIYEITYIEESNQGVARIIYPPSTEHNKYESNNWLLDFNLNCKGHNIFQFARHFPASSTLEEVIQNNEQIAIYQVTNPQHFSCR